MQPQELAFNIAGEVVVDGLHSSCEVVPQKEQDSDIAESRLYVAGGVDNS